MGPKTPRQSGGSRSPGGRRPHYKRRQRVFGQAKIGYIDYKNVELLNRFMSDRAKIRSRRVTGNTIQQQRVVVRAIKNAREMGLLSYNNRITSQRILRGYGGYRGGLDPEYEDAREAAAYADLTAQGYASFPDRQSDDGSGGRTNTYGRDRDQMHQTGRKVQTTEGQVSSQPEMEASPEPPVEAISGIVPEVVPPESEPESDPMTESAEKEPE